MKAKPRSTPDVSTRGTPRAADRPLSEPGADREYWIEKVHELPEVRIDKIRATRAALEKNAYETEQVLDDTIARLNTELELLRSDDEAKDLNEG